MESIDHTVDTVVLFLHAAVMCFQTDTDDQASYVLTAVELGLVFLNSLSSKIVASEHKLTAICLHAEQLKGLLNLNDKHSQTQCPLDGNSHSIGKSCTGDEENNIESEEEIMQYVILLLFSVTLISKLPECWNRVEEGEIRDDSKQAVVEEETSCWLSSSCVHLLEDHLLMGIYSTALHESFTRHYKSVSVSYDFHFHSQEFYFQVCSFHNFVSYKDALSCLQYFQNVDVLYRFILIGLYSFIIIIKIIHEYLTHIGLTVCVYLLRYFNFKAVKFPKTSS